MFARASSAFVLALPVLAAASVLPRTDGGPSNQCNTGSLQCCNSTTSATNPLVGVIAGLLGVVLGPITGIVGLTCSPITVIGVGGSSCTAQPVCCTGNNFNGVLVLGCSPVNLSL